MKAKIIFRKIRWKNFLSYGNMWQEIILDSSNITILSGKNGNGKSSILDALFFGLTGNALRDDINKDALVNNINKKSAEVEVYFEKDGDEYKVHRGLKPRFFKIYKNEELIPEDGKRVNFYQDKLEKITGLSSLTIKNTILINSKLKSFFELKKYEKRDFLDNLFNLTVFNKMFEIQKNKYKKLNVAFTEMTYENKLKNEKLKHEKAQLDQYEKIILSINSKNENDLIKIKNDIETTKNKIDWYEEKLALMHVIEKENSIKDNENIKINNSINKSKTLVKFNDKAILKKSKALEDLKTTCPTCDQELPKENYINAKNKFIEEIDEIKTQNARIEKEILTKESKLIDIKINLSKLNKQINNLNAGLRVKRSKLKDLNYALNNFEIDIPEEPNIDLKQTEEEILETKSDIKKINKQVTYLKIINKILLDGDLKKYIISQYIPFVTEQFNYFLEEFNFSCKFKFDSDFNAIPISKKYQDYKFGNFSSGERMRINLAILFAFQNLAKMVHFGTLNNIFNILMLDEYLDHGLDAQGIEDFLQIIDTKNKKEKISVFIISHKFYPENTNFKLLNCIKENDFSKIIEEII